MPPEVRPLSSAAASEAPTLTPAQAGFSMPAEWHPHRATWLVWPTNPITWTERINEVEEAYLRFMEAVSPAEIIELLVNSEDERRRVWGKIKARKIQESQVRITTLPSVDVWIRDYGPNFLISADCSRPVVAYNHWRFNAWGDKYKDLALDDRVCDALAAAKLLPELRFDPGFILEGGSIEPNGAGIILTTEQCLLNPNRNSKSSREQIEQKLKEYLGAAQILWLKEGIVGDDTDGHIDDIARFTDERTIVAAFEDNPKDPNHQILLENWNLLRHARGRDGKLFRLVKLPMPKPVVYEGQPLPASYANFYIANRAVVVPTFGDPSDDRALDTLKGLFPGREVVGVDCRVFVRGLGTFHCASQQEPLP